MSRAKVLGSGGSSTVHMAWHKNEGVKCAIKVIKKTGARSRAAWLHEATMMQNLEHTGICQLLDLFEDDSNMYLVLEYIEGHELFAEISRGRRLGEHRTAEIVRQILTSLATCHDSEIIHGDVKPENIMLSTGSQVGAEATDAAPQVKLIDFGLAMHIGQMMNGPTGTLPYIAPEGFASEGKCSAALDVWSTGIVLYACLTGELPCAAVRAGELPVLKARANASAAALDLLSGLLRPAAAERPSAAQASRHPWLCASGGPPPLAAVVPTSSAASFGRAFARVTGLGQLAGLLRRSASALTQEGRDCVDKAELMGWAAEAVPAEGSRPLLGCAGAVLDQLDASGSGCVALASWLAWLEGALEAAGVEAEAEPRDVFGLFDACGGGAKPAVDAEESNLREQDRRGYPDMEARKLTGNGNAVYAV